jgi:hypothetical protein
VLGDAGRDTINIFVAFHLQVEEGESANVTKYEQGEDTLDALELGWLVSALNVAKSFEPSSENTTERRVGAGSEARAGFTMATLIEVLSYESVVKN